MRSVYESMKDEFWRNQIAENKGNTKKQWRKLNGSLGETSSDDTDVHTTGEFAAFFSDKVARPVHCYDAVVRCPVQG